VTCFAKAITAGKFDRTKSVNENLYIPFFRIPINGLLNITFGGYYDGNRKSVQMVSYFMVEIIFMLIAFIFMMLTLQKLNMSYLSLLIGLIYLSLFTIFHTYYMARYSDISAIMAWAMILFFTVHVTYSPCQKVFKVAFFAFMLGLLGVLLRESTIVPIGLGSLLIIYKGLKLKNNWIISCFLLAGGALGMMLYYSWPQIDANNYEKAMEIGKHYRTLNKQALVSISQRFIFPFFPHILILIFIKITRNAVKEHPLLFLYGALAVIVNIAVHHIFGAGFISEGLGQTAPHVVMGALCLSLLVDNIQKNFQKI